MHFLQCRVLQTSAELAKKYLRGDIYFSVCSVTRCRLLCCCVSKNHQTANAFEDVAHLISDYFHVCFCFLCLGHPQFTFDNKRQS